MLQIIIPTRGRLGTQLTLQNLPKDLYPQVSIVCPQSEAFFHRDRFPLTTVVPQPDPSVTIAKKREWIMNSFDTEKLVMLDDDLRFAVRREDDPVKFLKATPEQIIQAFKELEEKLTPEVPHAGFSARGSGIGASAQEGGWQLGKRLMYVLGYHVPIVRAHAQFGRIETREDMDLTLQLFAKGFPNAVNFSFVVDQQFANKGGCTEERTMERSNADAYKLAALHPNYVKVTQKDYKSSIPRLEVVVQWQKAMKDGQRLKTA